MQVGRGETREEMGRGFVCCIHWRQKWYDRVADRAGQRKRSMAW